ncbi:MAG: hypothetical protein OHK0019_17700 [Saprospiraceae bacterium]
MLLAIASTSFTTNNDEVKVSAFHNVGMNEEEDLSDLQVTQTSSTSVSLSWTGTGTNFRVKVTNLTTQQVEQSFTVSTTSTPVSSLTTGHTYRFEIEQNSYVIAEDVLM